MVLVGVTQYVCKKRECLSIACKETIGEMRMYVCMYVCSHVRCIDVYYDVIMLQAAKVGNNLQVCKLLFISL